MNKNSISFTLHFEQTFLFPQLSASKSNFYNCTLFVYTCCDLTEMQRNFFYPGRQFTIATKHCKERVIEPLFKGALGLDLVPVSIDTDVLGTFSGEIARLLSPVDTLRAKCDLAFRESGVSLVISSEGSFGPHPSLSIVPADEEFLMLKDYDNDIEIIARSISTQTNFLSSSISDKHDLIAFTEKCGFPEHAIILRCSKNLHSVVKGINDMKFLLKEFETMQLDCDSIIAETDMRALFNPTRMLVIEQACKELLHKIKSECPNCQIPGYDVSSVVAGLPCERCSAPTRSPLAALLTCKKCGFSSEKKFPLNKEHEDPTYCDFCNP